MNLQESLHVVIKETGHKHYEWLVSDDNQDQIKRERYKDIVIRKAERIISGKVAISTGHGGITSIPLAENLQLQKEMKECKFYRKDSNCGCGKARCLAGKGEPDRAKKDGTGLVTTWDCYSCLRPDNLMFDQHAYKKPG